MQVLRHIYNTFVPTEPVPFKAKADNSAYNSSNESSDDSNTEKINDGSSGEPTEIRRYCSFSTIDDLKSEGNDEVKTNLEVSHVLGLGMEDEIPPIDKFIQFCVDITGSMYTCLLIWAIIAVWIILGIIFKAPNNWQIIMQDGQSIQTYIWDTFLMRQQLDDTRKSLRIYGNLRSRSESLKILLAKAKSQSQANKNNLQLAAPLNPEQTSNSTFELSIERKKLNWFEKLSNFISKYLGSLAAIIIYWIGVFVWIGCGALTSATGNNPPYTGKFTGSNPQYGTFTNTWQMYINTAVALELLITSVFLENIRLRNNSVGRQKLQEFIEYDAKLELRLREITGYKGDNPAVVVYPCPREGIQKWISTYAGIVGNGLGLLITTCVFAAWLGVGDLMSWSDNWWLIIGTYTGLVGFIDGFVLREVYFCITNHEEKMYEIIIDESQNLMDLAGFDYHIKEQAKVEYHGFFTTLSLRISTFINDICSSKWSVVFSVIVVVGLIACASALKWSVTGQLIANTPTMIIEGFFLLILIQANNWADLKRNKTIYQLAKTRKMLFEYIETI